MAFNESTAPTPRFRGGIIAAVLVAAVAIGAYVYFANTHMAPKPAAPPAPATPPPAAPQAAKTGPEFDVLRVDSAGNAVIAGRADPGATVSIKDGDTLLGTVTADANGSFAFVPTAPLPAGAQQITLSETLPNGQVIQGETSASVNVTPNGNGQSLAVITGPNGSRIVSGQGPVPGQLGLGTVDYDANGHAIFSGTAHAGDTISLSLDGKPLGTATTGKDGTWSFSTNVPENSGTLSLTDTSKPSTAITAPFALETLQTAIAQGHIIIAPGQNLWLIARHVYGKGTLYTLIYTANAKLIRDPNLIFPGQAFAIPKQK